MLFLVVMLVHLNSPQGKIWGQVSTRIKKHKYKIKCLFLFLPASSIWKFGLFSKYIIWFICNNLLINFLDFHPTSDVNFSCPDVLSLSVFLTSSCTCCINMPKFRKTGYVLSSKYFLSCCIPWSLSFKESFFLHF